LRGFVTGVIDGAANMAVEVDGVSLGDVSSFRGTSDLILLDIDSSWGAADPDRAARWQETWLHRRRPGRGGSIDVGTGEAVLQVRREAARARGGEIAAPVHETCWPVRRRPQVVPLESLGSERIPSSPTPLLGGVRGDGVLRSWQPADPTAGSWISGAKDLRLQAPGKLKSRSITVLRPSLRALSTA
jgi:hypothetical protein